MDTAGIRTGFIARRHYRAETKKQHFYGWRNVAMTTKVRSNDDVAFGKE